MYKGVREQLQAIEERRKPKDGRPSISELQKAARKARRRRRAIRIANLSRGAQLQLIDDLSRRGDAGIASLFGAAIAAATLYGAAAPLRAALWLAMVFVAAYAAGRLRRTFRMGEKIAGRPFRWRANYTASLAGLSAAVGAGAVLMNPSDPGLPHAPEVILAIAIAAPAAAWFHRSHPAAALCAAAPALCFVVLAGAREATASPAIAAVAALVAASGIAFAGASGRRAVAVAAHAHPRTRSPRRNDSGAGRTEDAAFAAGARPIAG